MVDTCVAAASVVYCTLVIINACLLVGLETVSLFTFTSVATIRVDALLITSSILNQTLIDICASSFVDLE